MAVLVGWHQASMASKISLNHLKFIIYLIKFRISSWLFRKWISSCSEWMNLNARRSERYYTKEANETGKNLLPDIFVNERSKPSYSWTTKKNYPTIQQKMRDPAHKQHHNRLLNGAILFGVPLLLHFDGDDAMVEVTRLIHHSLQILPRWA